jgi:hypothetical protein
MRTSDTYRGARRNSIGPVWGAGPFHAINWRSKRLNLSTVFKTYTIVHSSYGRNK